MAVNPYLMAALEDPDLRDYAYLFQDQGPAQPPMEPPPNPGMTEPQWQPKIEEEGPGPLGHVAHFLSYFNRPNAALWSAVKAAQEGKSAWEGAGRGFLGEEETGLADVLGMQQGQATDDWGAWLGKEIPRFAVSAAGDPLNALFAPIKGASLAARGARALGSDTLLRKAYATDAAKYLARGLNPRLEPGFTGALNESNRLLGFRQLDIQDAAQEAYKAIKELMPETSMLELNEMYARNPELLPEMVRTGLDTLKGYSAGGRETLNEALGRFNLPQLAEAAEGPGTGRVNWLPRPETEQGMRLLNRQPAAIRMTPEQFAETEFTRLVDPQSFAQGELRTPGLAGVEAPIVTKKGFLNPVEEVFSDEIPSYLWKGKQIPGQTIPATSKDIAGAAQAGLLGKEFSAASQVQDPVAAYAIDAMRKAKQERYLNFIDTLKGKNEIEYLRPGDTIKDGWREVNVPRMAKTASDQEAEAVRIAAPRAIANQLENLAAKNFDPTTPLGGAADAMQHFFEKTWPGQQIGKFKKLWTSSTLPLHMGFYAGNALSDIGMLYQSGMNPLSIASNKLAAVNVARGVGESLPGMSNQQLRRELAARGTASNTWSGSEASSLVDEARRGPAMGGIPGLTQAGEAAHKAVQWGYRRGTDIENNSRIAYALDYLKKNHPDLATMAPGEQAVALDRAAEAARNALVNYELPPAQQVASNVVPFIGWQGGILGRTAELAATSPQRLNRMGMALDTAFDLLSPEEKQTADSWIRESMPIKGALGGALPENASGLPNMAMLSRFIPQGDLERLNPMTGRPLDYAVSSILPILKLPYEVLANRNTQKDLPLDPVTSGFPDNILGPLLGKPYSSSGEKILGVRPNEGTRYLASQMPGWRYVQELNTLARQLGMEDAYRPEVSNKEALTWYGTGGKLFPYDEAKYRTRRQREFSEGKNAISSQLRYAASRGDMDTVARLLESLSQYSQRNPMEGRW